MIPGTDNPTSHHTYPGIFEKPDVRDATPDSVFTDAERLNILKWKITSVAGIDIEVDFATGKGTMSIFKKLKESTGEGNKTGYYTL